MRLRACLAALLVGLSLTSGPLAIDAVHAPPAAAQTSAAPPVDPALVKSHYGGHIVRGGRLDAPATVAALQHQGVNVYLYLISTAQQWRDFPAFLRAVQGTDITVWAYLVTPASTPRPAGVTEQCHTSSYVNGGDYVSISRSLGRLATQFPHLTGIAIDDFAQSASHNPRAKCSFFTPTMVARMRAAARSHRPTMALYPVLYHRDFAGATLRLASYLPSMDGAIFPYRGERLVNGRWQVDYRTRSNYTSQVRHAAAKLPGKRKLFVMLYGYHRCAPGEAEWRPGVCRADPDHLGILTRATLKETRAGTAAGAIVYRTPLLDLSDPRLLQVRAAYGQ